MGKRHDDATKHDAVRRWSQASGKGSAVKRHRLCEELGVSSATIHNWRRAGYGQEMTPDVATGDDVIDWLIAAGEDLSLDADTLDKLLAHRVRWERK